MGTYPRKTEKKTIKTVIRKTGLKMWYDFKNTRDKAFLYFNLYSEQEQKKKKAQICLYVDEQYNVKDCFNSFYSN